MKFIGIHFHTWIEILFFMSKTLIVLLCIAAAFALISTPVLFFFQSIPRWYCIIIFFEATAILFALAIIVAAYIAIKQAK